MVLLLWQTLFLMAFLVVDAVIITIGYVITLTNEYVVHLLFTRPIIYPLSLLANPLGGHGDKHWVREDVRPWQKVRSEENLGLPSP